MISYRNFVTNERNQRVFFMILGPVSYTHLDVYKRQVREGEHLKNDLLGKLDYMLEQVAFIEERSPRVVAEYRMKLEEKVHELLESASIDEGRICLLYTSRCV